MQLILGNRSGILMIKMGEVEEFNTLAFEKKLMQLKDTQESIQSLSSWCLKQREHHKKIVSSWLNVLKRVKIEQRLVLFYLANDVIQYSKRKNYEFVESWGLNLQKATPLVRDEKVRPKILRIFKIWEQRSVYDNEFLSDLTGLLSAGAVKKTDDDSLDFQPQQLVNKIKQCSVLEADTDLRLKYIHESHLELSDADALCANLKDRSNKDDVEKELNEGIACVERYTQALQREIVAREALLALLHTANQYYSTQRGEVKVVAYAYKNFGARVKALKRKLDELIPTLPEAAPSPPQRDEDVPSPGPDEDLELPVNDGSPSNDISYNIDRTFNTSISADGSLYNMGLSSFLTSDNPMAMFNESSDPNLNSSANRIEVINNRPNEKQDFNINDFLKTLVPNDNSTASDNNSVISGTLSQKSQDALPGLDLLTDTVNPPPPTSFYGALNDDPEPYHPDTPQWNNSWSLPPAPVPPVSMPPPVATPPSLPVTSLSMPLPLPPSLPSIPASMPSLSTTLPSLPSLPPSMPSLASFASPPASPPPAPPPPPHPVPVVPLYSHNTQDMPAADIDHRGILPPPPPPPVLPLLGGMEDVDHRMLPTMAPPAPPAPPPPRHAPPHQDVDHRNLISLTQNTAPSRDPRPMGNNILDQDYRVPPMIPPSDIVESVDMDLSEDEDQHMFQSQNDHSRRHSFNNNNKVLVGGDNGKTNHNDHNLIQINSMQNQQFEKNESHSAPVLPSMTNPFNNMLPMKNFNMLNMQNAPPNMQNRPPNMQSPPPNMQNAPPNMQNAPPNMQNAPPNMQNAPPNMQNAPPNIQDVPPNMQNAPPNMQNVPPNMQNAPPNMQFPQQKFQESFSNDDDEVDNPFDEDMRVRMGQSQIDQFSQDRLSPEFEGDWQQNRQFAPNQRFPRNWGPRTNFRPPFGPQFWPRNGPSPRPPVNRWMGPPRPQRFW